MTTVDATLVRPDRRARLTHWWQQYGLPLALFGLLSLAIAGPALATFHTRLISDGIDARHNLWLFWHVRRVVLGQEGLYAAPLLYYPQGISLLVHGVGPLTGLFALPFWFWGPAAAYNGALLVSLALSGFCAYLLAHGLGLERAVAMFVGVAVLTAPMVTAGLASHVTKVFTGAMALALLALHYAFDPQRSRWWTLAAGAGLLLVLLHNGYQFVFTALAFAFFSVVTWFATPAPARVALTRRIGLATLSALVFVGPLLLAIVRAATDPAISVDVNQDSFAAPDLLQFLLPPQASLFFGDSSRTIVQRFGLDLTPPIETAVGLALAGVLLALLAVRSGGLARRWFVLTAACVGLALGPQLSIAGQTLFTEYQLPIILPYAFLTGLPGLDFMRAPGRWMMLGFVAFAVTAGFGLQWLINRYPRRRAALVLGAGVLLLVQVWPRPLPTEVLPPVPALYNTIAGDDEQYGVFDLPLKFADSFNWNWTTLFSSSPYMIFQMTHGKGIASGYVSRTYAEHPVFPAIFAEQSRVLQIDGQPAAYRNFAADLQRNDYRYVVLHKRLFDAPDGSPAPGVAAAQELLTVAFAGQDPLVDNATTLAYVVPTATGDLQICWGDGWRTSEAGWRWAASPATLQIDATGPQPAFLELMPAFLHDPEQSDGLGARGLLTVQIGDGPPRELPIAVDQLLRVPLALAAGSQTVTLSLAAGNFQPAAYGGSSTEELSFALRSINLVTEIAAAADLQVSAAAPGELVAVHGAGWYAYEPDNQRRWATSPAELLVYAPTPTSAELHILPKESFDGVDGLGPRGELAVRLNGTPVAQLDLRAGQVAGTTIELVAGWNRVELALAAGNFQPSEAFPGNGDQRQLSFQVAEIMIADEP